MQSSVGLAFRALVMLACVALVPLLAIYGKQLPEFYRAVVEAYKARTQPKAADPLATLGTDAPAWAPTNDRGLQSAGKTLGAPAPWNNSGQTALPLPSTGGSPAAPIGTVRPASFSSPIDAGKSADAIATASRTSPKDTALQAGATDTCSVQFRHAEQRLRELGATYYLLETFGDGYRFYCEVSLAGNADSGHNRVFQATDPDPLQAMKKVLDEVEGFRGDQGTIFSFSPGIQR